LRFIVNRKHELRNNSKVTLKSIQKESIGLPDNGYRIRQIIYDAEQEEGVFLEPSLITNSLVLLKDFVLSGRGISILPELVVHDKLQEGSLIALPSSNAVLNSTKTSLITRVGRQLPVGAYRLMNCMQIYLKGMTKLSS
jgi:DNA-binding transcriptional LysR family regulator